MYNNTIGRDEPPKFPSPFLVAVSQQTNGFLGMGMMGLNGMLFSPKGRHFHYSTSGMAFNSGCDYDIDETEDGKLTARVRMPNLFASSAKAFEIEDSLRFGNTCRSIRSTQMRYSV